MNNLFKNGDYVLLEDCKAFDEKFGLEKDSTMWAVARKMEGGKPDRDYMKEYTGDVCVGIDLYAGTGVWQSLPEKDFATKLSVEDVLYRSKDGLTLDELSKIHGAFEDGKEYECVIGSMIVFKVGHIYMANGDSMTDGVWHVNRGHEAKFKPVTTKPEWSPSVGDDVMFLCLKVTVRYIKDGQACVEFNNGKIEVVHLSKLKPIDKERKRIINKAYGVMKTSKISNTQKKTINKLYDAGMLKEGNS